MQATNKSGQNLQRSADIAVNIGMRRIEPYDQQVIDALIAQQKQPRKGHKAALQYNYVAVLVCYPLKSDCCSSHLSIKILSPILFSIEKDAKKSTNSF